MRVTNPRIELNEHLYFLGYISLFDQNTMDSLLIVLNQKFIDALFGPTNFVLRILTIILLIIYVKVQIYVPV